METVIRQPTCSDLKGFVESRGGLASFEHEAFWLRLPSIKQKLKRDESASPAIGRAPLARMAPGIKDENFRYGVLVSSIEFLTQSPFFIFFFFSLSLCCIVFFYVCVCLLLFKLYINAVGVWLTPCFERERPSTLV